MLRRLLALTIAIAAIAALISSCKEDAGPTGSDGGSTPTLAASSTSVSVGSGISQSVTISGGTHPYSAQSQNTTLVTASFVNANLDTALLNIVGAVTTATGGTSIIVRDASTPQKAVSIGITKTQ